MMPRYFVARHVYFCFAGEHCVFLDLKRDEYSCIPNAHVEKLARYVYGWPARGHRDFAPDGELETLLGEMSDLGLLTQDRNNAREAVATNGAPVTASLVVPDASHAPRKASARDVYRFLLAATGTLFRLRVRGVECAVRHIERKKSRASVRRDELGMQLLRDRIAVFERLRPYFPARGICLFDSLALLSYLAAYDTFPTLVFGVRTEPFHAHCWAQHGEIVLNDNAEHAGSYTPVLVI